MNERISPRGRRHSGRPRRAFAAAVTVLFLTAHQVLAAVPAWAHGNGEAVADLAPYVRVARTLALAAAVLVAGAALVRPLAGRTTETALHLLRTAAAAGAVGAAIAVAGDVPARELAPLAVLLPAAVLALQAAVAWPAVAAGAVTVLVLSADALGEGPGPGALMAGHVAVAALWLGAILASATAGAGDRLALVRRLGPLAVGSAAALVLTGVLSARTEGVTVGGVLATSFGTVVLLKAGLLVLAALAGVTVRRRLVARRRPDRGAGRGRLLVRAELALAVAAALAGATLTSLPPPGPPAVEGIPLARALRFGDDTTGLLVLPQRPGPNLVHLMTDIPTEVVVAGRRYRAAPRPDAEGLWAEVDLPSGHPRLEIRQGGRIVQQVLDTGPNTGAGTGRELLAGPDAEECASAALGAVLGGSGAPLSGCPSDRLEVRDSDALRLLVDDLARRGSRTVRLVTDTSPRSLSAERAVRAAAQRHEIDVRTSGRPDAVLAVSGWATARAALGGQRVDGPLHGTWLAPWLVHTSLVGATGTAPLAALPFDPQSEPVRAYVTALRRIGPAQSATAAGLLAYLGARGERLPDGVALYAATAGFHVMPMNDAGAAHIRGLGWLAGGSLTPVSGVLGAGGSALRPQDALAAPDRG